MSVVIVVCCLVEVPAMGWSLVQRSPTGCGVSECDHEINNEEALANYGCCAMVIKLSNQLRNQLMNYIHHIPWQRNTHSDIHKTASPRMIPTPLSPSLSPQHCTPNYTHASSSSTDKGEDNPVPKHHTMKKVWGSEGKGSRVRHTEMRGKWPASRLW